jgi:penicillin amidase
MKRNALPSSPYPQSPVIEKILLENSSELIDDLRTLGITETRDDVLVDSLHRTINVLYDTYGSDTLNWIYGLHHTINVDHMAGLTTIEGGPIRGQHTLFPSQGWEMSSGPVYRFIANLANRANSRFVIAGGQSGNMFSEHFDDLFQLWYTFDDLEGHYDYHEVFFFTFVNDFIEFDTNGTLIERRLSLLP